MSGVATRSEVATNVLLIQCQEEAYANFLAGQWPKLPSWCGFSPTHGPVEVHHKNVVIAMTCGGKFKPEEIPSYVKEIKVFAHSGDFHIARQALLPHQGNAHAQVDPVVLFGGND